MLPILNNNQNIFIEITNLEHGGQGWELGSCLWSPVNNRGGGQTWALMNEIVTGDVIIHLVKINNSYHWYGISITNSGLIQTQNEPPIGGDWTNMSPYQRVNLTNFVGLTPPSPIRQFLIEYDVQLREY